MRLSIAYHSGYGHTAFLANSILEGALSQISDSVLVHVADMTEEKWNRLTDSDAIIFGSPTYMGNYSAAFKSFVDASSSSVPFNLFPSSPFSTA